MKRHLSEIVQQHMDAYGVSEAEVARRIGASPATVNSWRNGNIRQLPGLEYLQNLADLTHRRYEDVLVAALRDAGYVADGDRASVQKAVQQTLFRDTGKSHTFAEELVGRVLNFADPADLSKWDQDQMDALRMRLRQVTEILSPTLTSQAGAERYAQLLLEILRGAQEIYGNYFLRGSYRNQSPFPVAGPLGGLTGAFTAGEIDLGVTGATASGKPMPPPNRYSTGAIPVNEKYKLVNQKHVPAPPDVDDPNAYDLAASRREKQSDRDDLLDDTEMPDSEVLDLLERHTSTAAMGVDDSSDRDKKRG
ncbi:MAG: helix-turn-helix transcriptional regulator [Mycobacterium sp.]